MSTRLRVVLKTPNGAMIRDKYAILQLCLAAKPYQYKNVLKELPGSKRDRLKAVATLLPKGYTLVLVQEPKRTRKNRSYCWDKALQPKVPAGRYNFVYRVGVVEAPVVAEQDVNVNDVPIPARPPQQRRRAQQ